MCYVGYAVPDGKEGLGDSFCLTSASEFAIERELRFRMNVFLLLVEVGVRCSYTCYCVYVEVPHSMKKALYAYVFYFLRVFLSKHAKS